MGLNSNKPVQGCQREATIPAMMNKTIIPMMLSGMVIPREVPPNTVSGKFPPGSGPEGMRNEDNSLHRDKH